MADEQEIVASPTPPPVVESPNVAAPAVTPPPAAVVPPAPVVQEAEPKSQPLNFKLAWKQVQAEQIAPLKEIKEQLEKQGFTLAKPIEVSRDKDGLLKSDMQVRYDAAQLSPALVQGVVSGLKEVGQQNGMRVLETKEQQQTRQNQVGIAGTVKESTQARNKLVRALKDQFDWSGDETKLAGLLKPETQTQTNEGKKVGAAATKPTDATPAADSPKASATSASPAPSVAEGPTPTAEVKPAGPVPGEAPRVKQTEAPAKPGEAGPGETKAAGAAETVKPAQGQPTPTDVKPAGPAEEAKPGGLGEVQIKWKQQGNEVAPLLEMRAYLDQLKEGGIAVGALKFERGPDGKLAGSFPMSYDPDSNRIGQLEGALQGLKRVGGGLEVLEKPGQAKNRRETAGYDEDYEPTQSRRVREAFGVKQWDSLSAQLSQVPKGALSVPEQAQQAAGTERIKQLAQQQGKPSETIVKEGKSLLEIDGKGNNPVSAFLKNFYDHLNGAPKTRQSIEVDYEQTRQALANRLTKQAGTAEAAPQLTPTAEAPTAKAQQTPQQAVTGPSVRPGSSGATSTAEAIPGPTPAPQRAAPAVTPAQGSQPDPLPLQGPAHLAPIVPRAARVPFTEQDLPLEKLALFGIGLAVLKQSGQLQHLLDGHKSELLPMQVGAQGERKALAFEGKLQLHREENGSVTMKVELPRQKLEIPNEIGGQAFTPAQRQDLENKGSAGLIRGLRDAQGNQYNGFVGVDDKMKTIVILPENRVSFKEIIAGVQLTPEQSHDLREGKAVHLANMRRGGGGEPFDGVAQVHAAKAAVEVKPEPYEKAKHQQLVQAKTPEQTKAPAQQPPATTPEKVTPTVTPPKPKVKHKGPRH